MRAQRQQAQQGPAQQRPEPEAAGLQQPRGERQREPAAATSQQEPASSPEEFVVVDELEILILECVESHHGSTPFFILVKDLDLRMRTTTTKHLRSGSNGLARPVRRSGSGSSGRPTAR